MRLWLALAVLIPALMAGPFADRSLAQSKYKEAPILAEQVKAGKLPSVDKRLPSEPLVVPLADRAGQYGGVWRRAFLGPADANNYVRVVYDALVRFSPDGGKIEPKIAAGWESSKDFRQWTIKLRPGSHWSDGAPFTSDDVVFWYKDVLLNKDLVPSLAAWVPATRVSDQVFTLKRNPYFVGVDPSGNQLPYLDEVRFTFFADIQALNLAAIAGDFDMQERHIQMTNYPVFKENEKTGKYRVITWPTFGGADAVIMFNQTYKADPDVGKLMATREFRVALSEAINRDQIKESVFLGLGEPRQGVPSPGHPYFPGDQYAKKNTQYKPDEANKLLDQLGLTRRDAEGIRLMPSGKRVVLELTVVPAFAAWPDVAQLVAKDWEKVGVKTVVQLRERALHFKMRDNNELMTEMWNEDTTGFPFTGNAKFDPRNSPILTLGPLYGRWAQTKGAEGVEPPAPVKRIMEIVDQAKTVGPEQQTKLAQELFRIWVDNLWEVGTIGLTPMVQGVVVTNAKFRNVPTALGNDWPLRSPGNARAEQFFFTR